MVIAITRSGYIKRLPVTTYREQRRGGQGVMGMDLKEDDYIEHLFVASTHDYLLFFTSVGQGLPAEGARAAARLAPVEGPCRRQPAPVPVRTSRSAPSSRRATSRSRSTSSSRPGRAWSRRRKLAEYNTPLKADGIIAINLKRGRRAVGVRHSSGDDDILMVSQQRPGDPVPREGGAPDGPRDRRRPGHAAAQGRRGDRARVAARRRRPARRHRAGLRQAHARARVPAQGPRRPRREDRPARPTRRASSPVRGSSATATS